MTQDHPPWRPIAPAPCDDTFAWVRWRDGREEIVDFDHDSDTEWWARLGATHWRPATKQELEAFWAAVSGE
jgi:hypothetical protein